MSRTEYETWWDNEGSGMYPKENEDLEAFANRITKIAWFNGECVEQQKKDNEVK